MDNQTKLEELIDIINLQDSVINELLEQKDKLKRLVTLLEKQVELTKAMLKIEERKLPQINLN